MEKTYEMLLAIEKGEHDKVKAYLADNTVNQLEQAFIAGEYYFATRDSSYLSRINLDMSIDKQDLSQIALFYSALKSSNLFYQDKKITKKVSELREYVFKNFLDGGMLTSDRVHKTIDTRVLRCCSPYLLFEPEDLIVVATYQYILENINLFNSTEMISDMILYSIDKKEFKIANELLLKFESSLPKDSANLAFIKSKLQRLNPEEILHVPFGNNHPYQAQIYEREPRIVGESDQVILNAVFTNPKNPKVVVTSRKGEEIFQGEVNEANVTFKIGSFSAEEEIKYYFCDGDARSKAYEFKVTKKYHLNEMPVKEGFIYIESISRYLGQIENKILFSESTDNLKPVNTLDLDLEKSFVSVNCEDVRYQLCFKKESSTYFYGFGERYNSVVQNDVTIDNYVFSQYKDQGIRTYIPMPLAISNSNYALFVDSYHNTKFNLKEKSITVECEDINDQISILEGDYSEMLSQYFSITGNPVHESRWVLGPWMSSNNWDTQEEVLKQMNLTLDHDIPSTILVIEQWSDEATFYNFNESKYQENPERGLSDDEYTRSDDSKWPNPKKMVETLHENDLKCMLWQIPVLKQVPNLRNMQHKLDKEWALENDFVVKHADGSPYIIPEDWFKDSYVIDFSNEKAKEWWFDKRKYLVEDIKIDGFKTDGGECLFGSDIVLNDYKDVKGIRNYYPEQYIKSYYEFIKKHNATGITFSRAGYSRAHTYPAHWAGDERSTWDAFKRSICAGLNAGLSGIVYWGWDFAGFNGDVPTAELYVRATQMACFCPIMQYHAESKGEFNQDRTPWNIVERSGDENALIIYKFYAHLRMQLIPYIDNEISKLQEKYKPLMRAMFIEHPNDEKCYEIIDQYYFGDAFLVAPIINEGAMSREVYLPDVSFIDFFSLEKFDGNQTIKYESVLSQFPLFVKQNMMVPFNYKDGVGVNMKNKDLDFEGLATFIYTGECSFKYQDYVGQISNNSIEVNQSIYVIDFTNELEIENYTFEIIDWCGTEIKKYKVMI